MTDEEKPTPAAEPAAAPNVKPAEPSAPALRGRELRRALLAKLPPLAAAKAEDGSLIDVEEEMRAALDLDADGVLEPLEGLLDRGRS